jgi:hypothetical protein
MKFCFNGLKNPKNSTVFISSEFNTTASIDLHITISAIFELAIHIKICYNEHINKMR